MRKSTQNKWIASSGKALTKTTPQTQTSSFVSKMQYHPDAKEASQIIAEHAELEFDQTPQGKDLHRKTALQTDLDERFKVVKAKQVALEDMLKNTKQYIKSSVHQNLDTDSDDETNHSARLLDMNGYDQLSLLFLFFALPTCLFMGAANVYSNLLASGEAVFIDQPYLAVFIAMLMPAGSTAIKFISNFFDYQSTKKRYALFIYSMTGIVLFIWSYLFSNSFTGVAGGD